MSDRCTAGSSQVVLMVVLGVAVVAVIAGFWVAAERNVMLPDMSDSRVTGWLEDIPLPDDFDPDRVRFASGVSLFGKTWFIGPDEMIAQVANAPACAWIERWLDATEAGDAVRAAEARDALATARSWPVLLEIHSRSGISPSVWDYGPNIEDYPPEVVPVGHGIPGQVPEGQVVNEPYLALTCATLYPRP